MDKHFAEAKFIIIKDLQTLQEKYKSLAKDELRKEMPQKIVISMISQQLDQMLETIYEQCNKQNLTYMPRKQAIGIDLGTTYCCVGVMKRGKVHIILNDSENSTSPSYVAFGESVEESLIDHNLWLEKNDRKKSDEQIQNDMKLWPLDVVNLKDSLKIQLFNKKKTTLYPEEVSAQILRKLKKMPKIFWNIKSKMLS